MQRLLIIAISTLWCCQLIAQDITGDWQGALDIQGTQLRIVLHVSQTDGKYTASLDSPDQGANGLAITSISFENNELRFALGSIGASYRGDFKNESFEGRWSQGAGSLPLVFKREKIEKKVLNRPQEPSKPYPYLEEEVRFRNETGNFQLAGTLTKPNGPGPFPAVVLISGSGAQDRNEAMAGHKPFLVIADHLTRNGIAVLRYDDRGTARSEGDHSTATTQDLATDAYSAVQFLKERADVDASHIGLMGHSEGGIIAPMVAAETDDVAFIVLLAGTAVPGDELLLMQSEAIMSAQGMPGPMVDRSLQINKGVFDIIEHTTSPDKLKQQLADYILAEVPEAYRQGMNEEEFVKSQTSQVLTPWMQYFIRYNPAIILEEVDCPVLAVNGSLDLQVPSKPNLAAIEAALRKGGNEQVTTIEFPKLNHLFQKTETGIPNEYGNLEETFSVEVLEKVTDWIQTTTKK